jgi:hypothetical protein
MVVFNKWTGGVEGIHSDEMIETQEQHTQGKADQLDQPTLRNRV